MRYFVLLLTTVMLVAGCAAEEPTAYGPTVAGPTVRPKTSVPEPEPSLPDIEATTETTVKPLCEMFSTAEISARLGLAVRKVVATRNGPYAVCTWTTVKPVAGEGTVILTRSDASQYEAYSKQIIAEANLKKARGRKELAGVGDEGFAMGASVNGIPNWYAVVVHAGVLTGVRMSGAVSKASVAAIKEFMIEIHARS